MCEGFYLYSIVFPYAISHSFVITFSMVRCSFQNVLKDNEAPNFFLISLISLYRWWISKSVKKCNVVYEIDAKKDLIIYPYDGETGADPFLIKSQSGWLCCLNKASRNFHVLRGNFLTEECKLWSFWCKRHFLLKFSNFAILRHLELIDIFTKNLGFVHL